MFVRLTKGKGEMIDRGQRILSCNGPFISNKLLFVIKFKKKQTNNATLSEQFRTAARTVTLSKHIVYSPSYGRVECVKFVGEYYVVFQYYYVRDLLIPVPGASCVC